MNVGELIEFLKSKPRDMPVAYQIYSEQCTLEASDIHVEKLSEARPDGWVHNARPDQAQVEYLVFPGN